MTGFVRNNPLRKTRRNSNMNSVVTINPLRKVKLQETRNLNNKLPNRINSVIINNPLRKVINSEKRRINLNKEIANAMKGFELEQKYIRNNPGELPNRIGAAHRKMLYFNGEITRLREERNALRGGKKQTRRHKK